MSEGVVTKPIGLGSELAKPADRDIDDVGAHPGNVAITHTEPLHRARSKIFENDVAAFGEFQEEVAARVETQIETQAAFVAIDGGVHERHGRVGTGQVRLYATPNLALQRLDLDDLGAKVTQDAAAHRARPGGGGLEDPHTVERPCEVGTGPRKELFLLYVGL